MSASGPTIGRPAPDSRLLIARTAYLARHLKQRHALESRESGLRSWATPGVHTWQGWLKGRFQVHRHRLGRAVLLSEAQQVSVWQSVLESRPPSADADAGLVTPAELAARLHNSWSVAGEYAIDTAANIGRTRETALLDRAGRRYERVLEEHGWLDHLSLVRMLTTLPGEENLFAAVEIAGFTEVPPVMKAYLERISEWEVEFAPRAAPLEFAVAEAADERQELESAARWAQGRLELHPGSRVAVAVADLDARRAEIRLVMDRALCPPSTDGDVEARPYRFSKPEAIAGFAIVRTALDALHTATPGEVDFEALSRFIRSPWIHGDDQARGERARADCILRRQLLSRTRLAHARGVLERDEANNGRLAGLAGQLRTLEERAREASAGNRDLAGWADHAMRILDDIGWPGPFAQDPGWPAAGAAFADALRQVRTLSPLNQGETFGRFVEIFEATLALVAPAGEDAPATISVIDHRECLGARFDYVWITGVQADRWPRPVRHDPYLDSRAARAGGVPGCSADSAVAEARAELDMLRSSGAEVMMSWALRESDRAARPSPLLDTRNAVAAERSTDRFPAPDVVLEALDDFAVGGMTGHAAGGSQALADQAQCPFRSVARHRLAVDEPREPPVGISAALRGSVVHRMMQQAYAGSAAGPPAAAWTAPDAAVRERALDSAVQWLSRVCPDLRGSRLLSLEARRLRRLFEEWLELESGRPPFAVVETESERTVRLGDLEFTIKPDRVDRLGDDTLLVIDYKTGEAQTRYWADDRLLQPQVPLYVIASDARAAAFARLVAGDVGLFGVGDSPLAGGRVLPPAAQASQNALARFESFDALIDHWRESVDRLANELARGIAAVAPAQGASTCRYCEQYPLCRIDSYTRPDLESQDDGD